MPNRPNHIDRFDFAPGRAIGRKYVVDRFLGSGYEGEVYAVSERATNVQRALKIFYPHRNERDRALRFYAQKLDRLRHCPVITQYHHSDTLRFRKADCSYLVSELVEGELLADLQQRQIGKRLPPFEAVALIHALAVGLEQIHRAREYHGDVHDGNILVRRAGIRFEVKLVDFYHYGRAGRGLIQEDVIQLIRVLYDLVGGKRHYATQPMYIKQICRGLRRDLISQAFPTAGRLRRHLETFAWA